MHPHLLQLGPWTLSTYGVMLAAAFLLVIRLASDATARASSPLGPLPPAEIMDWASWALLGGIAGGRVLYIAVNWELYRTQPLEMLALWHGGLIWYGGLLGGVAATVWYLRHRRHGVWQGLDQVVPFIALGHAVGRLGCFFNGCCLGRPTSSVFGVLFPGDSRPVMPVQLIESLGLVVVYLWLRRLQRAPRRPGWIFGAYLTSYGVLRWLLEYWRDQPYLWSSVTLQQLISLVLAVMGMWLLVRRGRCPSPG